MQITKRHIAGLYVLTIALIAGLSAVWEFFIEPKILGNSETLDERLNFILQSTFFSSLAALLLALIAVRAIRRERHFKTRVARSQWEIREAEDRFRDYIEFGFDWFWETDAEGRFSFISDNFFEMTGESKDQIIGKSRFAFSEGRGIALGETSWDQHLRDIALKKPFREFKYKIEAATGGFRAVSTSGRPVYDGKGTFIGYRGAARDTTQRLKILEDLHKSEDRFRDFSKAASDWFWETDAEGRFTFISDNFFKMTGVSEKQIIGKTRLEFVGSEAINLDPETWKIHARQIEAHKPFRHFDYRVKGSSGHHIVISISGKPAFDNDGAFLGYRGTGADMTELQFARENLIAAKEDAERANQAKSQFLASMSHELRTPMNAIIGFGELMLHNPPDPISDKNKEYLSYILSSATHLMALINQVLELSSIESGNIKIKYEKIFFKQTIEETVQLLQAAANRRGIDINMDCDRDGDMSVWVDVLRLKQILFNLLSNAIKYNRDGGSVDVSCGTYQDNMLKITIRDTGMGIPANRVEDLFQPFNRLGLEARHIEGTGIGLTITKDLVERMGGEIGYENIDGGGSSFWIALPRTPGTGDQDAGASESSESETWIV